MGKLRNWVRASSRLVVAACVVACGGSSDEAVYPAQPAPSPTVAAAPPPGAGPASGSQAPAVGPPSPSPGAAPPPGAPAGVGAPVASDPLNRLDPAFMASRAQAIIQELSISLTPAQQARIAGIPLAVDPAREEINAFAACIDGRAMMAVTAGMLEALSHLAQARAHDQRFGTAKATEYINLVAQYQQPDQPVIAPPAGFYEPVNAQDASKVAAQHTIFDEALAFVLGHELAHHYLGHLPCTGAPGFLGSADLARRASSVVPLFNQPNELASDVAGTNNVLTAGAQRGTRGATPWTEGGAMLVMDFFTGLSGPSAVVFAFERSHPPPQLRRPIVQQTASSWRASGGRLPQLPPLGL